MFFWTTSWSAEDTTKLPYDPYDLNPFIFMFGGEYRVSVFSRWFYFIVEVYELLSDKEELIYPRIFIIPNESN